MTSHLSLFNLFLSVVQKVAFEGLVRVSRFDWWLMSAIPRFVSSGLEAVCLSPGHITLGLIYTVREERKGGREKARDSERDGRKGGMLCA